MSDVDASRSSGATTLATTASSPVGEGAGGSGPKGASTPVASGTGATGSLSASGGEIAVGALVLSVLWLFFLGSLAGLVLGLVAKRRLATEASNGTAGPSWAPRVASVAVAIGALGTVVLILLGAMQLGGVINLTSTCAAAATGGLHCRLVVRR